MIEYVSLLDISAILFDHRNAFKALKSVRINSCSFGSKVLQFIEKSTSLTSLAIKSCWLLSAHSLASFVHIYDFSSLLSLDLASTNINDACLQELATKSNQIHSLNISFCNALTDKGIQAIIES